MSHDYWKIASQREKRISRHNFRGFRGSHSLPAIVRCMAIQFTWWLLESVILFQMEIVFSTFEKLSRFSPYFLMLQLHNAISLRISRSSTAATAAATYHIPQIFQRVTITKFLHRKTELLAVERLPLLIVALIQIRCEFWVYFVRCSVVYFRDFIYLQQIVLLALVVVVSLCICEWRMHVVCCIFAIPRKRRKKGKKSSWEFNVSFVLLVVISRGPPQAATTKAQKILTIGLESYVTPKMGFSL